MSTFNLKTAFTNEQLRNIYIAGINVIVAKPTGGGNPNVAWQVYKPLQGNTITWKEEYGIYASTSDVVNGARLSQLSSVPVGAIQNKLYTLEPDGSTSGPASGGKPNSYALENKYSNKDYMTVGLFQDANVNGTDIAGNAISAVPTLLAHTAVMTPYTTVYIWLESNVVSNTVVTNVTSPMTALKFGGGVDTISVAYDSETGKFIPTGDNAELITHIEPCL
ncbi:hypothetical protein IMCC3317_08200 [Kordia antarctica]|uniref:Uncharacterized protein n=1 Tax=Kordia antarctica TaxID=1218801 RepID=A0A7L4ZHS2_9FLAO|nr:hypothetical protein [Kordia antarctica]QHI35474.1 hypothetical protein IMCC3317_08200 [Kordia antarctica]